MVDRETGSFEHQGERIYYESLGTGDPVVLSHGLGGNHASWWRVAPGLAEHHRVVSWDQRGFGNSTRRSGRYGPEPAVGDLLALLDHLELDRAQLVGQSMGGWVTLAFAVEHPERVAGLVLTDTLAGVSSEEIDAAVRRTAGPAMARRASAGLSEHPALGEAFCRRRPDLAFLYQQLSSLGDKPDDAEVLTMLAEMRVPPDRLGRIDFPVLLVVGADDLLCSPEAMSLVADQLPGAELHVIADAGHSPYFERPEEWTAIVGPFLGANGPPR